MRPQDRRIRVAQGQVGAVRAQQALGAVHDLLQQLVRVADGGDLGGQLLQGPLRLHLERQLGRLLAIGDGGRGVVAKRPSSRICASLKAAGRFA